MPCDKGEGMGTYGMYPLADMFNHEFGSTDVAITEGKGGEMCFQISSGRDTKEGEQVMVFKLPSWLPCVLNCHSPQSTTRNSKQS